MIKRKLLGIGSFLLPIIIIIELIIALVISQAVDTNAQFPEHMIPILIIGMCLLFISVIGVWFYIIYDIIHIVQNPLLSGKTKVVWIIAIWCLNVFLIPVYWFKYQKVDISAKDASNEYNT